MTADEGEVGDTSMPAVRGPGLSIAVLALLGVTYGILAVLLWVLGDIPDIASPLLPIASGGAAVAIGYDATKIQEADLWWQPRPWVWAFAMVPPLLNLGFCAGYVWQRLGVTDRKVPSDRWFPVLAAGVVLASGAVLALSNLIAAETTTPPLALTLSGVGLAGTALTLVAIYFDVHYVRAILSAADERWRLGGRHWIPLLALFHPTNLLFLGVYYLRRRSLLGGIEDPSGLLTAAREDGGESTDSVEG